MSQIQERNIYDSYLELVISFITYILQERICDIPEDQLSKPRVGTRAAKLRKSRRYMIYVHSKLMIIDDTYIICGSANINQVGIFIVINERVLFHYSYAKFFSCESFL